MVYLLDRKAVGSTGASKPETQKKFLQIMGIVEEDTLSEVEVDSPLTQEAINILAAANSHRYSHVLESVPNMDGLYLDEHLDEMIRMWKEGVHLQCSCVAHRELLLEGKPEYKHHLRQLLKTSTPLQNDMGILFAVFLRALVNSARQVQFCSPKVWCTRRSQLCAVG